MVLKHLVRSFTKQLYDGQPMVLFRFWEVLLENNLNGLDVLLSHKILTERKPVMLDFAL